MKDETARRLVDQFGWPGIKRAHRMHTIDGEGTTAIADAIGTTPRTVELVLRLARQHAECVRDGQRYVDALDE
jgi:hypothetical protein